MFYLGHRCRVKGKLIPGKRAASVKVTGGAGGELGGWGAHNGRRVLSGG